MTRNKHIWIFNAGNSYSGNPKWLFEYIRRHHPDIRTVWMCYHKDVRNYVKRLGYEACLFDSTAGKTIMKEAGVYVVEMCKEVFQPELEGITILNLWHGVGCKSIERKVTGGFLQERIAKKYIRNNRIYKNAQLFLVTSELMEKHFMEQCGIDEELLIRAGYPRCTVTDPVCTYPHDIRAIKGLSDDARIVVYAPTYRDYAKENFIKAAIPDMDRLTQVLQGENILLVLKMHPLVEKDTEYLQVKVQYEHCPNLLFWDNANDIYEIFEDVDAAIIDYSSIFYDFMARGVRKFIRYLNGDEEDLRDFVFDVKEMTCGEIATNFEQLLQALQTLTESPAEELDRLNHLFWSYSNENSCEIIIERALQFTPLMRQLPTLYSFDIFDTLISRKCLYPTTIFSYVQSKMCTGTMDFPPYLLTNYSAVRQQCEQNVREYYKKSVLLRNDDHFEIQFKEIFDHMAALYGLDDMQKDQLMQWEIEGELEAGIPLVPQISLLKKYIAEGNDIVLISDMYLPKEVIVKLLQKADPLLATLPLYVSSEVGHQKTTRKLFLHVYSDLDYCYEKWIHIGDNRFADQVQPEMLGIQTAPIPVPEWTPYEKRLADYSSHYEFRCVARQIQSFRLTHPAPEEQFAYCYAALYLVPYVVHAVSHAVKQGYRTLYFISRDGHYLKQIADEVIASKGYSIRTKYIYGSRKAWRIPSFIDHVDEEFFSEYGSMMGIQSFTGLLSALCLTEADFDRFFPELGYVKHAKRYSVKFMQEICGILKNSSAYRDYLLQIAAQKRSAVIAYLQQEITFKESFAFIEYWGRGYTQDCLTRLLSEAAGYTIDTPMYYVRSIYPTVGHSIRYNYSSNMHSLVFVESIFANVPYETVQRYERAENIWKPVLTPNNNKVRLHAALETSLPTFSHDFLSLQLQDEETVGRLLYNFGLAYFSPDTTDPILLNVFSNLKDSVALGEKSEEYAPPITCKTIINWMRGNSFHTKDLEISMKKSSLPFRAIYRGYAWYCKDVRDRIRRRQGKKIY